MTKKLNSKLAAGAFVAALAFAVPATAQTTPQGAAQGAAKSATQTTTQTTNKAAANTQRDKKPGQSCDSMDKKSKAYSDCVKTQAQSDKKPKPPEAAKTVEKGKKKG